MAFLFCKQCWNKVDISGNTVTQSKQILIRTTLTNPGLKNPKNSETNEIDKLIDSAMKKARKINQERI